MSVSTVFERLNCPRNYYSNNYANQWRGIIEITFTTIYGDSGHTVVKTFQKLRKMLENLPFLISQLTCLRFHHKATFQGNLFRLPYAWIWNDTHQTLEFVDFPQLRQLPKFYKSFNLNLINCPRVDFFPATCQGWDTQYTKIQGHSDGPLLYLPYINIRAIVTQLENCQVGDIYIPVPSVTKLLEVMQINTLRLELINSKFDYYNLSHFGNFGLTQRDTVIPYIHLLPFLRTFKMKCTFSLLRSYSILFRHRQEMASLNTPTIVFSSTLACNTLRRALEYI